MPKTKEQEEKEMFQLMAARMERIEDTFIGKRDPGYCGLGGATLGKWDPLWQSCRDWHDPIFDDLLEGKITKSQLGTLGGFGKSLGKQWIQAAYTLVAAPIYFLFGGVLGMVRYRQLIKKGMVKEDPPMGPTF